MTWSVPLLTRPLPDWWASRPAAASRAGKWRRCYGATKAFDLILAEGLWAEWHRLGVDVLALVLGRTDTPALRKLLDANGQPYGDLADPADVARAGLDHLADGPTWIYGSSDPMGGSPMAALSRRNAVLAMSRSAPKAKSGA